jgi:polyvinyl alcohol dehydrogenase (cytochrome)
VKDCLIGYTQAITATPELVFAGNDNGWLRAFDAKSGAVMWQIDCKTPVKTVSGEEKTGGSFGGGSGPVLYHGMLYASSGYSLAGQTPGNLLLAFEAN